MRGSKGGKWKGECVVHQAGNMGVCESFNTGE